MAILPVLGAHKGHLPNQINPVDRRLADPLRARMLRRPRHFYFAAPHFGSLAHRFNHERPHSRLGWLSPAIDPAQQRSAALRSTDGSALRTAAIPPQLV